MFKRFRFAILICASTLSFSALGLAAQDASPTPAPTSVSTSPAPSVTATPGETATPSLPVQPLPSVTLEADGVIAELYFEGLRQGRAGLLRVTGAGVAEASGLFANRVVPFFADPDEPGAHYALLAVSMEQTPRAYALEIYATLDATGAAEIESPVVTLTTEVEVELGGFLGEAVDLPTEKAYLVSAEVERAEFARLSAVFEALPGAPAWDELGFQTPISAELTSRYGSVRTLNGTFPTRHTGWDLRAATGTPVRASAGGRVAFAGVLDIRGNHVIIDHGAGVFSGYSHLSQVFVTRGQQVVRDEIIGLSGNTGRSSGPHLHWEIAVNGEFIDSAEFADLWLP